LQQIVAKTVSKEYPFKMTETTITTLSSTDKRVIVSGQTKFEINVATFSGSNYVLPDFTETLIGTFKLDEEAPTIELRQVPIEEAKHLIHKYIKEHPGARTTDLILDLALDPEIVIEALSQLRCEGKVEGKDIDTK
jgi:hypothetical protein